MKWLMLLVCISLVGVSGCGEEFTAGVAAGVAAAEKMSNDAQDRFITAVNELNAETERINTAVGDVEGTVLIRPETKEAVESVVDRKNDPMTWVAGLLALTAAYQKKKRTDEAK